MDSISFTFLFIVSDNTVMSNVLLSVLSIKLFDLCLKLSIFMNSSFLVSAI